MDAFHLSLTIHIVYHYLIDSFGDVAALLVIVWCVSLKVSFKSWLTDPRVHLGVSQWEPRPTCRIILTELASQLQIAVNVSTLLECLDQLPIPYVFLLDHDHPPRSRVCPCSQTRWYSDLMVKASLYALRIWRCECIHFDMAVPWSYSSLINSWSSFSFIFAVDYRTPV
jgi:hypothetical protein